MTYAAISDQGRLRKDNQDRCLAMREHGVTLLAVADGVAGEAGGAVASEAAVDALASTFEFATGDMTTALGTAMRAANDAVLKASLAAGHPHAASTLVAATVNGPNVAVANLGDSRAYLVRDGVARQVTEDHRGEASRSITRFVGDDRGVTPDVFVEVLGPRDRLVLCSDGLTVHVTQSEIASIAPTGSPERAARALVSLANERGGKDNVTVIVYAAPAPRRRLFVAIVALAFVAIAAAAAALAYYTTL